MYTSISILSLAIWGDTVMGTVDSYDSRLYDTDAETNRSRTVSKGYSFTANGKDYRGYVIYNSDESWPRLKHGEMRSERISYIPIFPYINKPSSLADFGQMGEWEIIYHTFAPIGCLFIMLLVTRSMKPKNTHKKTTKKHAA